MDLHRFTSELAHSENPEHVAIASEIEGTTRAYLVPRLACLMTTRSTAGHLRRRRRPIVGRKVGLDSLRRHSKVRISVIYCSVADEAFV